MKKKSIRLMILGCLVFGIMVGCASNEAKTGSGSSSKTESSEGSSMTQEEKDKAHAEEIEGQMKYDAQNNNSSAQNSSVDTSTIPDEIIINDEGFVTDLDKIFNNVSAYAGKKITVEGFVRNINGKNFSVLRYYDMPHEDHTDEVTVGINIEYDGEMPKTDDWVKVTGTIGAENYNGSKQPIIKATRVDKQFTWGQKKVTN